MLRLKSRLEAIDKAENDIHKKNTKLTCLITYWLYDYFSSELSQQIQRERGVVFGSTKVWKCGAIKYKKENKGLAGFDNSCLITLLIWP